MAKGTGHGAQLAFGTTAAKWAPAYTTMGGWGYDREALDCSHLGTQGTREYLPGDLYGISAFPATYWWEPNNATSQDEGELLFDSGKAAAAEQVTMTMPDGTTFVGNGFIQNLEYGEITTDVLLSATLSVMWSTAPTKSIPA